ncbi:macro domain-containing protein [Sphingobium sp. YR768]|uniref:macro domain-containing protein n=1 Tax=Sphingobium sp. YR768 TaxID=1884365 RepID=UPI0008C6672F|nr:macro domain-containing protein [Sphingobium sp. YR768]SES16506.1 O-acetyl-ADP-ribose deacetylase (regulator of RNase III), contains Macro domain [Sphingobium sp. YR768]
MLIYRRTSLLESPSQTLVNTVNCVGVMGKGLAQAFKTREPKMFEAYKRICDQQMLEPGKLWLWRGSDSWVLNFPTKVHWRNPSRIEWIEQGLAKFVSAYAEQGITEIAFPQLGCGNGGLDWNDVKPLMEQYLAPLPIPVFIHDFAVDVGLPEHLETVAATLKRETADDGSFDGFRSSIRRAVDLSCGHLSMLGSNREFQARMDDSGLLLETDDAVLLFEDDDLRGIWHGLQSGLVTKREAGWSIRGTGESLVSLLSVLPSVRPVVIERHGGSPEYAIEPNPHRQGFAIASQSKSQHELAWH